MANSKPEVTFTMNEAQAQQPVPGVPASSTTPREHKFLLTGVGNQNLVVFSETKSNSAYQIN